jgi:hypothetical protein
MSMVVVVNSKFYTVNKDRLLTEIFLHSSILKTMVNLGFDDLGFGL